MKGWKVVGFEFDEPGCVSRLVLEGEAQKISGPEFLGGRRNCFIDHARPAKQMTEMI